MRSGILHEKSDPGNTGREDLGAALPLHHHILRMTQETVGTVLLGDAVVSIIAHEAAIAQAAVTEKGDNHDIREIQGHRDGEEAHLNPVSRHHQALIATGLVNNPVS